MRSRCKTSQTMLKNATFENIVASIEILQRRADSWEQLRHVMNSYYREVLETPDLAEGHRKQHLAVRAALRDSRRRGGHLYQDCQEDARRGHGSEPVDMDDRSTTKRICPVPSGKRTYSWHASFRPSTHWEIESSSASSWR